MTGEFVAEKIVRECDWPEGPHRGEVGRFTIQTDDGAGDIDLCTAHLHESLADVLAHSHFRRRGGRKAGLRDGLAVVEENIRPRRKP